MCYDILFQVLCENETIFANKDFITGKEHMAE
jgi:hypothetical protein